MSSYNKYGIIVVWENMVGLGKALGVLKKQISLREKWLHKSCRPHFKLALKR